MTLGVRYDAHIKQTCDHAGTRGSWFRSDLEIRWTWLSLSLRNLSFIAHCISPDLQGSGANKRRGGYAMGAESRTTTKSATHVQ